MIPKKLTENKMQKNNTLPARKVVLSIHKIFWDKILAGEKTIEVRRSFPKNFPSLSQSCSMRREMAVVQNAFEPKQPATDSICFTSLIFSANKWKHLKHFLKKAACLMPPCRSISGNAKSCLVGGWKTSYR